ncbi:MAG TPA: hypothetical protein PLJ27_16040 [Polyangiaceae bacterium]|nr:hypothetical protein [Polyangiaceae bacterium]
MATPSPCEPSRTKKGVTTPLEQRPAVRFIENVGSLDSRGTPASSPKPAAKATLSIGGK